MKNNRYFLFSIFILSLCFLSSCGGDDKAELPTIVGEWTITEQIVQTNYPELDKDVNKSFRDEIKYMVSKRQFLADGEVITTVSREGSNDPIRKKTENYRVEGDTLLIDVTSLNITTKSDFLVSYKILTTKRVVDRVQLASILVEMGRLDPNLLPANIEGEIRTKEVK